MKLETGDFLSDLKRWTDDFLGLYVTNNASPNTIASYRRVFGNFYEFSIEHGDDMSISEMNGKYLSEFVKWRKAVRKRLADQDLSPVTISNDVTVIKAFYKHISDANTDLVKITRGIDKIKIKVAKTDKEHLTPSEVQVLFFHLSKMRKTGRRDDMRNSLAVKLMLSGGFRASEVLKVKLGDFYESSDPEIIEVFKTGKGAKERYHPMKRSDIEEELEYFMEHYKGDSEAFLMTKKTGKVIVRTELNNIMNRLFKSAGIKRTGLHILRHSYANRLIDSGADLLDVKELLDHAHIQTTMVYTPRPNRERAKERVKALDRQKETD